MCGSSPEAVGLPCQEGVPSHSHTPPGPRGRGTGPRSRRAWLRYRFRLKRRQISHRQISLRTGKFPTNFSPLLRRHTHPRHAHSREIFLPWPRGCARARGTITVHARFALFVMGVGWSPPSRFFSPSGLSGWWSRLGGDPCSVSDVRGCMQCMYTAPRGTAPAHLQCRVQTSAGSQWGWAGAEELGRFLATFALTYSNLTAQANFSEIFARCARRQIY